MNGCYIRFGRDDSVDARSKILIDYVNFRFSGLHALAGPSSLRLRQAQSKNNANGHDAFFVLWANLWRFVAINFVKICFVSGTFGKNVTSLIFCSGCPFANSFQVFFYHSKLLILERSFARLLPWGRIIVALLAAWGHRPFRGQKIEAIR